MTALSTTRKKSALWMERSFFEDLLLAAKQVGLVFDLYLASVAENRRFFGLGLLTPFLSVLVHVILLGAVLTQVFGTPSKQFLPYFAISLALWQAIATTINHHASANQRASRFLMFPNLPGQMIHCIDFVEFAITLVLKLIAAAVIIAYVDINVLASSNISGIVTGLFLLGVTLFAWAIPLAYLFDCIRVLRALLSHFLYAAFLITPILWQIDRLRDKLWVAWYNPLFHMIEVVRVPMLTGDWPVYSYLVAICLSCFGLILSRSLYKINRKMLVFRWIA